MSEKPVILFDKVNKWFGDFHVLRDIDLKVAKGERIVICGPSGSGKSTMIRCINRLEEHQQGTIVVDGVELTDDLKHIDHIRSEVGMVFQSFNLFPHMTVLDNLVIGQHLVRRMPKMEAEEVAMTYLERVKITDQAGKYPGQLSGGQQQRVAIARSLCMKPKIMLFDEPTSALDVSVQFQIIELLRDLQRRHNLAYLFISHDLKVVRALSNHVIVMKDGVIVESGTSDQIFESPKTEYTRALISAAFDLSVH